MINIIVVTIFIIFWSQKDECFRNNIHHCIDERKQQWKRNKNSHHHFVVPVTETGNKEKETSSPPGCCRHSHNLSLLHTHTLSLSSSHTCTHTHCFSQIISCFLNFSIIWRFACQGLLSRTMWTNKHAASTPPQAEHSLTSRPYPHVFIASLSLSLSFIPGNLPSSFSVSLQSSPLQVFFSNSNFLWKFAWLPVHIIFVWSTWSLKAVGCCCCCCLLRTCCCCCCW